MGDGAVNPIRSFLLLLSLPTVRIMLPCEYYYPPFRNADSQARRDCGFLKATQPVCGKARLSDPFQTLQVFWFQESLFYVISKCFIITVRIY